MLIEGLTKRLSVPGEDAWIEVRMPSFADKKEAVDKRSLEIYDASMRALQRQAAMRAAGSDELVEQARAAVATASQDGQEPAEGPDEGETAAADLLADPLFFYDLGILLKRCVVKWSYGAVVKDPVNQLDGATAEWLGRQILTWFRETEEERKNALAG